MKSGAPITRDFHQSEALRRRSAYFILLSGVYLLMSGLISGSGSNAITLVRFAGGLLGIGGGLYRLVSRPKPEFSISEEGIRGRKLLHGKIHVPADRLVEVVGGGDNLRVRLANGQVESFSMLLLSAEDRAAAVETAKELIASRPDPSSELRGGRPHSERA